MWFKLVYFRVWGDLGYGVWEIIVEGRSCVRRIIVFIIKGSWGSLISLINVFRSFLRLFLRR